MFEKGTIWAYPTDTSFGLGVRVDDEEGLENLELLKKRQAGKFYSIMVSDFEMLQEFAKIPAGLLGSFFTEEPRTIILEPTDKLPKSKFWPEKKVAFRISTIAEISKSIKYPITATSANLSGSESIFKIKDLKTNLNGVIKIKICDFMESLEKRPASEIWDFTVNPRKKLR